MCQRPAAVGLVALGKVSLRTDYRLVAIDRPMVAYLRECALLRSLATTLGNVDGHSYHSVSGDRHIAGPWLAAVGADGAVRNRDVLTAHQCPSVTK